MSILIIGFLATMIFGFSRGQQTEKQLQDARDSLFPASKLSQKALTAFDEQANFTWML